MSDASYSAQVAADIAARYGVAVQPGAVQVVPRGTSGIALPVWDGQRLIVPDWKEKRQRLSVNRAREARRAGAASDGAAIALREQIAALHAQGMSDAEMAAETGKSFALIGKHRRFLHLTPIRKAVALPERPQDVRRRRVRELIEQGRDRNQIADLLGVNMRVVTQDAAALRLVLAVPVRAKVVRQVVAKAALAPKLPRQGSAAALQRANEVRLAARAPRRAEVLRLLASGLGFVEVAEQTGFTLRHVHHIDRQNRLATGQPTLRVEALRADVARLAAQGLSRQGISEALQRSRRSVNRHLTELGYQVGDLAGDTDSAELSERRIGIERCLRDLIARGLTRAMMAAEMGMSRKRLSIWLARIGVRQGDVVGDDGAPGTGLHKAAQQEALRERIADLHQGGMPLDEIAAAVGRPVHSVRMLLHFAGASTVAKDESVHAATARRARITELAAQGATRLDIIAALGIDRHRLAYDLRALKLDLPRIKPGRAARSIAPKVPKLRLGRPSPEKAKRLQHVREMAASGMTRDVMAKALGCDYVQLSADIKAAGVVVPRLSKARYVPTARMVAADARRSMVADLRNQGATLVFICSELGLPRSTVCADLTVLRRQGRLRVGGRVLHAQVRRASDPENAAHIRSMAAEGLAVSVIARRLGFSRSAVAAVLAQHIDDRAAA